MMRIFIVLIGIAMGLAPGMAKADEEICFINNSAAGITIFSIDYGGNEHPLFALYANTGDQNTCHSVPVINGNSIEGDSQASYFDMSVNTDGAFAEMVLGNAVSGNTPFTAMPGMSQIGDIGMSFLNPVVGEGSFYYVNPWGEVAQDVSNSDLEWASGSFVCNRVNGVCRSWSRGDDGVYRVVFSNMAGFPKPTPEEEAREQPHPDDDGPRGGPLG